MIAYNVIMRGAEIQTVSITVKSTGKFEIFPPKRITQVTKERSKQVK
jgi:hypothetical protein